MMVEGESAALRRRILEFRRCLHICSLLAWEEHSKHDYFRELEAELMEIVNDWRVAYPYVRRFHDVSVPQEAPVSRAVQAVLSTESIAETKRGI